MKRINLLHQTFGQLTAIGVAGHNKSGQMRWLWRCSCGNLHKANANQVKRGETKSCGCGQHPRTHGASKTPEFATWSDIRQRCGNPNFKQFADYGGRGITVCERWQLSFENFYADMGKRPEGLTLERIDNNQGYSPENCKWATRTEQVRNRRTNRMIAFDGLTLCASAWESRQGLPLGTVCSRLQKGWSVERALTRPRVPRCRRKEKR